MRNPSIESAQYQSLVDEAKSGQKAIPPVSRGELANEYGDKIADYSKEKSLSNSLLAPYITSVTHGEVFSNLITLIDDLEVRSLLDLGCGAGEFLALSKEYNKKVAYAYGCTIHLGEVEYANQNYLLDSIVPADMREIHKYFCPNSFDAIIAHCCLQFITVEDRQKLLYNIRDLLTDSGYFIVVDYKFNIKTGVAGLNWAGFERFSTAKPYKGFMGNLTILKKITS